VLTLYENGLNGILADEMGLGKTLQTIAFIAHLKARKTRGPILVVAPLSVLHNWQSEFEKFAPTIPVCVYHGTPEERAQLRKDVLSQATSPHVATPQGRGAANAAKKGRKSTSKGSSAPVQDTPNGMDPTPVFLTTYEMIIRDRAHLAPFEWRYIIVDEGHRLKNMDSKLMQEIKKYASTNRMILTGTPLHNNLAELWSLLNFILPDIFNDLDSFQQWFNFPTADPENPDASTGPTISQDHTHRIITSLHGILKPFLLRRLKSDVEHKLPPKKEYILYAPLTRPQVDLYEAILARKVRQYLIDNIDEEGNFGTTSTKRIAAAEASESESSESEEDEDGRRKMRLRRRDANKTAAELGREFAIKEAIKTVNNMSLQNMIMQLRKTCAHPFLFFWPRDPDTQEEIVGKELERASGKMMLLNRLLEALIGKNAKVDRKTKRPHKVLIFSQFTRMLDIIQDWAEDQKGWPTCRIDGSRGPADRRAEMDRFNNGGNGPDAPRLFLLSTRAGGLGINLVEADTVIFYDQDWNPQMDLQAQDRAHRIGQTRPVLIFRLVTNYSVETKIMARSGEKRKLEALVIAKGKFKVPHGKAALKQDSLAEMAAALLHLESEKIHIVSSAEDKDGDGEAGKSTLAKELISDEALAKLLDRSPAVFEERGKGWKLERGQGEREKAEMTAFEVFEHVEDEANNGLATMMGEDD
ncbi:hypothetical protein DL93DRAFT_2051820, partial [Clavulina sp. PMI_390]